MCIRDRRQDQPDHRVVRAHRVQLRITGDRVERKCSGADPPRRIVGARPVSYTHLRAHETVLDLVCRLLLEKTQNTSSRVDTVLRARQAHGEVAPL